MAVVINIIKINLSFFVYLEQLDRAENSAKEVNDQILELRGEKKKVPIKLVWTKNIGKHNS